MGRGMGKFNKYIDTKYIYKHNLFSLFPIIYMLMLTYNDFFIVKIKNVYILPL